jgi:hypothetical protein
MRFELLNNPSFDPLPVEKSWFIGRLNELSSFLEGAGITLPEQWTVTAHGELTIAPDDPSPDIEAFTIRTNPDANPNTTAIQILNPAGQQVFEIDGTGTMFSYDPDTGTFYQFSGSGGLQGESLNIKELFVNIAEGLLTGLTGFWINRDGSIHAPYLPTTDPHVAGQLWCDIADGRKVKSSNG